MVKLFAIQIHNKVDKNVQIIKSAYDLQSFGYFQRGSVKEFMDFTGKIIVERTNSGTRASVKEQDYMCHVFCRGDSLAALAITDKDYPQRVCFSMLNKVLDEFSSQVPASSYANVPAEAFQEPLTGFLTRYQNPEEADPMTKVQTELDETKVIVYNTIEQVLQRGEKLDDLVAKSEDLSTTSTAFYKTAKKTNSCCGY